MNSRPSCVSKVVAIHQPNFFPWLGYFNKIALSDTFIIMDNVQFPKKGGTWSNRVKLLINGQPQWLTMPVMRNYHGTRNYREIGINNARPWRDKVLKTIQLNYARADYFQEIYDFIEGLVNNPTPLLVDFNLAVLKALIDELGLDYDNKIVLGSALNVSGCATELLIQMTRAVGGSAYLCGGGATGYQQDAAFEQAKIDLMYQNFNHPVYAQQPDISFVPGLSVLDALMHCGFAQTRALIYRSTIEGPFV